MIRNLILIYKINEEANYILIYTPINGEDIVTKYFDKSFNKKNYKWITYLSATSVYGNHNGEWVNEFETKPTSSFGSDRLNAENSWIELSAKNKIPLQIFRLSGIYSEKNNILEKLRLGIMKERQENHFFQEYKKILQIFYLSQLKILKVVKFTTYLMIDHLLNMR